MSNKELINYYKSINIEKYITFNRRGAEENVKVKILLPMIKFLGYDLVSNTDFELKSIDIVLLDKNSKPILFIEAKSWDQNINKHLDQCLEYTYKLRIPFAVIMSGKETAIYSTLINDANLKESKPLFRFSFNELIEAGGEEILSKLHYLISKESVCNDYKNLYDEVKKKLVNKNIDDARKLFFQKCFKYKPVIKTSKITNDNFEKLISLYPREVSEALRYGKDEFVRLTKEYKIFRLRYMSKEIGIEFIDKSGPRHRKYGLVGIYPEKAQVIFGGSNWKELVERKILTKRLLVDKIKKYDGNIKNIKHMKELINILEEAFINIVKIKQNF
ncbi:MAG: type I restriction enzyme HsdR N-terminal domain-containing protein [Candidatus Falkowbacteria bacterium]